MTTSRHQAHAYLSEAEISMLDAIAKEWGTSRSAVIIRLIREKAKELAREELKSQHFIIPIT